MYESHWGLRESPFRGTGCARFFEGPTHEEALARLDFLVEQGRRLGLLCGPSGSGKSLLLAVFGQRLRRAGKAVARLGALGLEVDEFLAGLSAELCVAPRRTRSRATLWRALTDRLTEFRFQQIPVVILIDDADTASREVLSQLARLSQLDQEPAGSITVVLASQPQRAGRLGPRLLELADLRIDLTPWEEVETADFLRAALSKAGGAAEVFDDSAMDRLQQLSGGIPRRVSQLADLALAVGAGQRLARIGPESIEAAYHELSAVEVG